MKRLLLIAIVILALGIVKAETIDKTITLHLLDGLNSSLNILPHTPDNNSYYSETEDITIRYVIDHYDDVNVSCGLILDNNIILQINNFPETYINSVIIGLSEDRHSYKLNCTDTLNNSRASVEKILITDYTPPSIQLTTLDRYLTFMDYIQLNFTPHDNLADRFTCSLYLNSLRYEDKLVTSHQPQTFFVEDLENGTYEWYVACTDLADNQNTSETRTFFANLNQEFDIILNQEEYDIAQQGYYIITAPYGGDTTLMVTDPKRNNFFRYYIGKVYPIVDIVNFTKLPGTYTIEGILTFGGGMKNITKQFIVRNSFTASIEANKKEVSTGFEISFNAYSDGSWGSKTYEWNFGDSAASTEKSPKHSYQSVGNYNVKLKVTDEVGNTANDVLLINVKNTRNLEIVVKNLLSQPLQDVSVFVEGERKQTNAEGKSSFTVLDGLRQILIIKPSYESILEQLEITQDTSKIYYLEPTSVTNLSSFNFTNFENYTEKNITQNSNEVAMDEDLNSKIDRLTQLINNALYNLNNFDKITQDVAVALKLEESLQEAKKNLLRATRDLDGVRFIRNVDERQQRRLDIEESINDIEKRTVANLDVKSSKEYSVYPSASDIDRLIKRYFEITKKTDEKELRKIIEVNKELQSQFLATKTVYRVTLTFLSENEKTITLISEELQIKDKEENNDDLIIIEFIPKEIVKSSEEITFLTPHEILEKDPIIVYHPSKINKIIYSFEKEIDVEDTKKINTILVDPTPVIEKKGFSLTGFAIFSTLSEIENPALVIQIALIILLLCIYIIYEFEILVKIRKYDIINKANPILYIKKFINKDLHELQILINKANKEIQDNNLSSAEESYHQLINIYNNKLNSDLRKNAIDKISEVYNALVMHRIQAQIKEIKSSLEQKNKEKAKELYEKVKQLYGQLPKSWKSRVSSECTEVFKLISV